MWKVFGPRGDRVVGSVLADQTRAELSRLGNVLAVRDVSFSVAEGELFVVMGLSGSGKSTLVRCLSRLVEPTAGQVLIDGEDVTAASPERLRELRRTRMSMVFQHFGLLPHRRLLDNVAFGLEVQRKDKASRLQRANDMLDLVGLGGLGDAYPDQLSGGMQQRVGLARALANDPEILLFDEPFSALDPLIRRDMQDEVLRLQRELGKTTVFITHDLAEALKLGDRIAIMKDGRFVQVGTPAEVVARPADGYVREFTRDVQRAQVLRAEDIMGPPPAGDAVVGPPVATGTLLAELVRRVAEQPDPLPVLDESGAVVGSVDRARVLTALAGGARQRDRPRMTATAAPRPLPLRVCRSRPAPASTGAASRRCSPPSPPSRRWSSSSAIPSRPGGTSGSLPPSTRPRPGSSSNRADHWFFSGVLQPITDLLEAMVRWSEDFLELLGWPGIFAATAFIAYRAAGWRIALVSVGCLVAIGVLGVWEEAIQTMALMMVAVAIALLIGVPLGIMAGLHPKVDGALRGLLDAAQTMPAYCYLLFTVLLFDIGAPAAVIATVIFALAPAVRLTAHGIRAVSPGLIEVGAANGATDRQVLGKIQWPLARPAILLGVNQVIMMAFGVVVIAALVGSPGLGQSVLNGLEKIDVGLALDAGLAIVLVAVILDRISSGRSLAERRVHARRDPAVKRRELLIGVAIVAAAVVAGWLAGADQFPEGWTFSLREPVNDAVTWLQENVRTGVPVIGGTSAISDFLVVRMLEPLRQLLADTPWWIVTAAIGVLAWCTAGRRVAAHLRRVPPGHRRAALLARGHGHAQPGHRGGGPRPS